MGSTERQRPDLVAELHADYKRVRRTAARFTARPASGSTRKLCAAVITSTGPLRVTCSRWEMKIVATPAAAPVGPDSVVKIDETPAIEPDKV